MGYLSGGCSAAIVNMLTVEEARRFLSDWERWLVADRRIARQDGTGLLQGDRNQTTSRNKRSQFDGCETIHTM